MKFNYGLVLLASLLALSTAIPAAYWEPLPSLEETLQDNDPAAAQPVLQEEGHGLRFARATCDLLSFSTPWGSANHSICAAHCLSMRRGFRGGRCIDGVCNCRR